MDEAEVLHAALVLGGLVRGWPTDLRLGIVAAQKEDALPPFALVRDVHGDAGPLVARLLVHRRKEYRND